MTPRDSPAPALVQDFDGVFRPVGRTEAWRDVRRLRVCPACELEWAAFNREAACPLCGHRLRRSPPVQ